MNKERIGSLQIAAASIIRGFSQGTFPKIIDSNAVLISFFRILIPAVYIYVHAFFRGERIVGIFSKDKAIFHLYSLLTGLRLVLFLSAYQLSSLSVAAVIYFASAVYMSVFEARTLGITFSVRNLILSILCFGAMSLVILSQDVEIAFSNKEFLGYFLMFIASVLVVIEMLFKKKFIERLNNNEWIFYQHFLSSFILLPVLFIFPFPSLTDMALILLFSILTGIVAFSLMMSSLRRIRLSSHNIINFIEPLVTIVVGVLIFGEELSLVFVLMAAVVFGSIWYSKKED